MLIQKKVFCREEFYHPKKEIDMIVFKIERSEKEKLKEIAKSNNKNVSYLVREAIEDKYHLKPVE